MTWILPKQLTSAFAQDTEALTSDSAELSRICEQSLMRRSKHSPAKTYLREWKAGNLMRLRSGAISSPSLGRSFLAWWISSLADTRANHSQPQESGLEHKIRAICGPTLQTAFDFSDLGAVSLKTSKDISRWGCPTSSKTWQDWVTERRGAYSARLKSALHTSGSECSSWPTTAARDYKGTSPNYSTRKDGKSRADQLAVAVDLEERSTWPTPTVQEAGKIGNQANHGQLALSNHPAIRGEVSRTKYEKGRHGHPAQASSSMDGSRQGLWATPIMGDSHLASTQEAAQRRIEEGKVTLSRQNPGKLNPRWVETLMGLPVGWTMPSCASPVTIGRTNSDC